MKLCQRCGTQLYDQVTVCPNCGQQQYYSYAANNEKQAPTPMEILVSRCKTSKIIMRIFSVLFLVSNAVFCLFNLLCGFIDFVDNDPFSGMGPLFSIKDFHIYPWHSFALSMVTCSFLYIIFAEFIEGQRVKISKNDPVGIVDKIQFEKNHPSWIGDAVSSTFLGVWGVIFAFGMVEKEYVLVVVGAPMLVVSVVAVACFIARAIHFRTAIKGFVEKNKDYFLELERRSLIEGTGADILDDTLKRNISYYYQFDINSVYNAYVSVIKIDLKKKCTEKPYYTVSFPMVNKSEDHMCYIHLEPCNGGTMVYIRYTLPKTSKENYEVTNNRLCESVGMLLTNPAQMYNPSYR